MGSRLLGLWTGFRSILLPSLFLVSFTAGAQTLVGSASAQTLDGVIDIHAHADPDSVARSIDALDLARLVQSRGMRGMVLKNHWEPTASLAFLARKEAPGLEVFGGVVLNLPVGGVNPAAVERMAMVNGGWGRVVWMPTFDAENHVRVVEEDRPFVSVSKDGELLAEVIEVIGLVAELDLMLETGHSSPEEVLMIIREARRQGVERIVVTHPLFDFVGMTVEQMKEAASLGAYLEITAGQSNAVEYARVIREVGPESIVLSSDLGQATTPLHPDGLLAFFEALESAGISREDIRLMSATNPAEVLGLR